MNLTNEYATNQYCFLFLAATILPACSQQTPADESVVSREGKPADRTNVRRRATNWPCWWGPSRDGKSTDRGLPVSWTKSENVIWARGVEGRGHSSPCIWSARLFLTTADEQKQQQKLLCYDRRTGELLWRHVAHEGGFMKMHPKNSHASATPACDGDVVYLAFLNGGALCVTAVDVDGDLVWQRELGPFGAEHGYGSSPALHEELVIVLGDNMTGSFLAALNRETGDVVWRTARETTGQHGSYATPIVTRIDGKAQVVVTGMSGVASYDPDTGEVLWTCDGPAEVTAGTVASNGSLVFASGGFPEKELLAIRADGRGDVSESHVEWRSRQGVTYVPSPLHHDGMLFVISDDGIATCFDAASGESLGRKRLEGDFSASPIVADGLLYVPNESGKTFVLRADSTLETVAENDLEDGGFASVAIAAGEIFLRTNHHIYCIGDMSASASSR